MLMLLFLGAAAFWSGFDQSAGSFTIFTRDYVNLYWVLVSWTQIANPLFIVILLLSLQTYGYSWAKKP